MTQNKYTFRNVFLENDACYMKEIELLYNIKTDPHTISNEFHILSRSFQC